MSEISEKFEQVSKIRPVVRFASIQGDLTTEILWDLPLTAKRNNEADLNSVAKVINKQLKEEGDEDFVNTKSKSTELIELKLDIVKYIIKCKQLQEEEKKSAKVLAESKARRKELIIEADLESEKERIKNMTSEERAAEYAKLID